MALTSGTKLGPYEIVSMIGAGGMGEVYRARDQRLGRNVAVKVLPVSFAADPDRLRRFEQEARAIAALSHPNILGASPWRTLATAPIGGVVPDPPVITPDGNTYGFDYRVRLSDLYTVTGVR